MKLYINGLFLALFASIITISHAQKNNKNLHELAQTGHTSAIKKLVQAGTDVDIRDSQKRTPLMLAAAHGNMRNFLQLLALGADLKARDKRERNAVQHAVQNNHRKKIERTLAGLILLANKLDTINDE